MPLTELIDDSGISDETVVYRRIAWAMLGVKADATSGEIAELNGNCFQDYKEDKAAEYGFAGPCMSVALGSVLQDLELSPEKVIEEFPGYGLAVISVGALRRLIKANSEPCPQGVLLAPTEKEPWHSVVFDQNQRPRVKSARKAVSLSAEWEVALRY